MISEIDQQTLDINWFFVNKNNVAFVASAGGKLPESVAANSYEIIIELSNFFRNLSEISDIIINPNLDKIIDPPIDDQYLSDFALMAKRGLFSFDKTVVNNFSDTHYHLVAKPITPLNIDQLPIEIKEAISKSQYQGNMDSGIDASLVI